MILILLNINIFSKEIKPIFTLTSQGAVRDFVIDGDRLYAGNNRGTVDIFDLSSRKMIDQIRIEPYLSIRGEYILPIILSVDRYNGKTLIVSVARNGFRNVWVHNGKYLKNIVTPEDEIVVTEARFVDDDKIMFGTLGYEMILYDTGDNYQAYSKHVEQSSFSDVAFSQDKTTMATASESGEVTLMDVGTSDVLQVFKSENVDKIYRIAYRNGTVITGGQDRRVGVYQKNAKAYHIKSDFLVYCVGLSPSAKIGVYSSGMKNDLQLFDVSSGRKTDRLVGHFATLNSIQFVNENILVSAGDEPTIFIWRID